MLEERVSECGSPGSGLPEDGPVPAADLRAAPPAAVLRQPAGEERERRSGAGPPQQQEDTIPSPTHPSRGNLNSATLKGEHRDFPNLSPACWCFGI